MNGMSFFEIIGVYLLKIREVPILHITTKDLFQVKTWSSAQKWSLRVHILTPMTLFL
jgi:hypothetical protein